VGECEIVSVADEMRYISTDGKHYLNIGVKAIYAGGDPILLEPDKCKEWRWFDLKKLPDALFEATNWTLTNYLAKRLYKPAR